MIIVSTKQELPNIKEVLHYCLSPTHPYEVFGAVCSSDDGTLIQVNFDTKEDEAAFRMRFS